MGFFGIVFIPICSQMAVEITFPLPPNISSGILGNFANLLTIAFMIIFDLLQEKNPDGTVGSMSK